MDGAMAKAKGVYTPEQRAAIQKMTAADTGLTPVSMPFREAVARAGTLETLLSALRAGRVMARYSRLYSWPEVGAIKQPTTDIMPSWWAHAHDIDPAAARARFTMALADSVTYEVLAVGIELERDAVEALWPAATVPAPRHAGTERKAKSKSKPKFEKKPRPQVRRAISILIELYPPTGIPPAGTLLKTARTDVNKVIAERNKVLPQERKEPLMKPDSFSRAILFLTERNAP
jgi:hypothetical protein